MEFLKLLRRSLKILFREIFNLKEFLKLLKVKQICIILILLFGYMIFFKFIFLNSVKIQENEYIDVVVKDNLKVSDSYISFESKVQNQKISLIYFFENNFNSNNNNNNDLNEDEVELQNEEEIVKKINYGDIYTVKVQEINTIDNSFENRNSFNYKGYMLSKKITQQIVINEGKYKTYDKGSFKKVIYSLKNFRKNLIIKIKEKFPINSTYINSLVLGEKLDDEDLKENIQKIGIIQLFTISGLHINFLVDVLEKYLKKLKVQQKYIDVLIFLLLPIYGVLCNMGVSIKRVILMKWLEFYYKYRGDYSFLSFNSSQSELEVSKFQIWLYVFIFSIVVNPFNLLNVGFVFSYFITLYLILNQYVLKDIKGDILKNYYVTTFMLPVAVNLNFKLNVLIFFTLKYYDYLVRYMMIICMLIVLFINFSFIVDLLNILLSIYVVLLKFLNWLNLTFVFTISYIGYLGYVIYYYFYFKQMEEVYYYKGGNFKYLKVMICILVIFAMNINILGKVDIIDVGQGDSILIKYPLKGKTILIDTGDEVASDEIIEHLESEGVRKIDYFILTHNHMDHIANFEEVLENFKVENLVINNNYYTQYTSYFNSSLFKDINIIMVNGLLKLPIGYVYCHDDYLENENNNSIVFFTKLGFNKWLFMGDIETEIEEELLEMFDLNVDYVKLGHHGSNTSTTENFLLETSPKKVFISSGKNNMYGHPSEETLEKLKKYNIKYADTQKDGEIVKYFL